MAKKTNDGIKFHNLFNSAREHLNVPLRVACYGLCSDSMMNYIENGERLPDYRMRNRIMARLGVSSEEYEDFLQYDEYERWKRCQNLIEAVEQKRKDLAESILNELFASINKDNKIEYQFLLDMKGRVMEMNGIAWEEIAKVYAIAVELTMPNVDFIDWNQFIFAPEEYYILLRLLIIKAKDSTEKNRVAILNYYKNICESIQRNLKQSYASAKVYPMAVVGWYQAIGRLDSACDEIIMDMWSHSYEALDALRNASRAYYLIELLKIRQLIWTQIKKRNLNVDNDKKPTDNENNWLNSFQELYGKYAVDTDINYSGYIYTSSVVYCISDIIASRRSIYGLSRKELAEGVCTERTIIRIEKKQVKPQQFVIERLFKKLGVVSDYLRAEILTNDYATLELYSAYKHALNDTDYKKAYVIERELYKMLDLSYPENKQVMADNVNNRKLRTREIDKERYFQNMKNIIGMTLPEVFNCLPEAYLSDMEVTILKNIAFEAEVEEYQKYLIERSEQYYRKHMKNYASLYEFIMGTVASRLGNNKQYIESNQIAEFIIKEALRLYRVHAIHRNVFNITWNEAKMTNDYFREDLYESLKHSASLSSFCKEYVTESFYKRRMKMFENNEDWTE